MMQSHVGVLTEDSVCLVPGRPPYQPSQETEQVLQCISNLFHSIGAGLNILFNNCIIPLTCCNITSDQLMLELCTCNAHTKLGTTLQPKKTS